MAGEWNGCEAPIIICGGEIRCRAVHRAEARNHGLCGKLLIWKGQNFGPYPFERRMDVRTIEVVFCYTACSIFFLKVCSRPD